MKSNTEINKYQDDYNLRNYDRMTLLMQKGTKEKLSTIAAEKGISVNGLINTLISEMIEHYEMAGGNKSDLTDEK